MIRRRAGAAEEFERVLPERWAALHRVGFDAEETPLLSFDMWIASLR